MSLKEIIDKLTAVAEPVASRFGFVLVDVRFGQLGRKRTLEVTIFKPGGTVGLDDCELVSRALEAELEAGSPPIVDGSFLLEIQSPGIERELKTEREFAVFVGQMVEVRLRQAIDGLGETFHGILLGKKRDRIAIGNPVADKKVGKPSPKGSIATEVSAPDHLQIGTAQVTRIKLFPGGPERGGSRQAQGNPEYRQTG